SLLYPAVFAIAPQWFWPGNRFSTRTARHRYSSPERIARAYATDGGAAAIALSTNKPLMTAPAIASAWESDNFLNPVFTVTFQDQANRRSREMNRRKVEANRRRLETTSEELSATWGNRVSPPLD